MSEIALYNAELVALRATVAQLDTVEDAKDLSDRAAAAQTWARRAHLGMDAVNRAAEVKLRAERRAGQLLSSLNARTSGRTKVLPADVSYDQSSDWQALASIPEDRFDEAIEQTKTEGAVTRNGVMRVHYSSATPEWSTPQDLFDQLDAEFGFTLDVCATAENAKCKSFYTEADDGLARPWSGVCWMNPPYGDVIAAWVAKAHNTCLDGRHIVVCLVPARTDTAWWWNYARYGEVRFLRGRLKFGGGESSAPFPSAVVIFGREPRVVWWER